MSEPVILERSHHPISRSDISQAALNVLYGLKRAGYEAYLVGGGIRDIYLGQHPKDFDIVTNALPDQVKETFPNCRLIGRRFRLAHVRFGRDIIEVATFRGDHDGSDNNQASLAVSGQLLRDNVYGDSVEEDAFRRDFTINALFYNIADFSVIDCVGALEDLDARTIRVIGDADTRFREDPVRLLRAVRFAAKLNFSIDPSIEDCMASHGKLLRHISSARLFDECLKLFMSGHSLAVYQRLCHYQLFRYLFPTNPADHLDGSSRLLQIAFRNTDQRVAENKPVAPFFLFAVILWEPLQQQMSHEMAKGTPRHNALHVAADQVLAEHGTGVAIPRRIVGQMKDVWILQSRFSSRRGNKPFRLFQHPKFRAAYDFLLLRNESGDDLADLCDWWTRFQAVDDLERSRMTQAGQKKAGGHSKRRKRKKSVGK